VVIVVTVTALVLTPLILGGVYLGFYVGDQTGYSRNILGIAFSTGGFLLGMAIIWRVILAVSERAGTRN
jgi:hypothetical protein